MNKKKRIIFVILTISLIIIIGSIIFHIYYNRELIYKESLSIKIGDKLPSISDYFDNNNLKRLDYKKIKWEDIKLEDDKIYNSGNYNGYVTFRKKKITIKLKVIDDEVPVIENVKDITIYVNEEIDLLKEIKTSDNSHDNIELKVIGEYDTSKVSEYSLTYIATDKSNNKTASEFKLIVKEKEIKKAPTPTINSDTTSKNLDIGITTKGYTIKK